MDYLVKATPTRELLDLSAVDRDELMAAEREVATDLIAGGAITWMWRLPDTQTSIAIWNAESAEALEAHLKTLPVFPYNTVEITALAAHPAFPTSLSAASRIGR
jgi:muconolactone D-isomerase